MQFWIDRVRAPRFNITDHYVPALNIAMKDFINDRYDNLKDPNGKVTFEAIERVRDELYTLIKEANLVPTLSVITTQPADYMYEIGMRVNIDGVLYTSRQLTYNELDDVELGSNAFTAPAKKEGSVYHVKTSIGFRHIYGVPGTTGMQLARLRYLMQPPEIVRSETVLQGGGNILTIGQLYLVLPGGTVTNNGNTFQPGQYFVAQAQNIVGFGSVVLIVDCILPVNTHEEICKRAANILTNTIDDYTKMQTLKAQEKVA